MIDFTIRPDDGEPYELKAGTRDVYVWEKADPKNRSVSKLLGDVSVMAMYQLAHVAAYRQQMFNGTLDEFVGSNELDFTTAEAADPTPPAPSTGA
jgi:hypothetical protein